MNQTPTVQIRGFANGRFQNFGMPSLVVPVLLDSRATNPLGFNQEEAIRQIWNAK